jgi:hypothetical protein
MDYRWIGWIVDHIMIAAGSGLYIYGLKNPQGETYQNADTLMTPAEFFKSKGVTL